MKSIDVLNRMAEILNLLTDTEEWKIQHESDDIGPIEVAVNMLSMLHFDFYHHYLGGKLDD